MKKVDYIIVGQGFAGSFLALEALQNHQSVLVVDTQSQTASRIAAGVYNPLVLKRFNVIWNADPQISFFIRRMKEIEQYLKVSLLNESPVCRIFHNEEEKNTWLQKAKNEELRPYLNTNLISHFSELNNPYGAGKVNHSGRIQATVFLDAVRHHLQQLQSLDTQAFQYDKLQFHKQYIQYQNYQAQHLIFAEGKGVLQNPYFQYLPIQLNKGECLNIQWDKPLEDYIYKSRYFLFPVSNQQYYVGGTYEPNDKSEVPTEKAQQLMINQLSELSSEAIQVTNHQYAFRPVTPDRRPMVGAHPKLPKVYILNGLGSRGTLLGAMYARVLIQHIRQHIPLDKEVDIQRFQPSY